MGWDMRHIFLAAAVPAVFAAITIWLLKGVVRAARGSVSVPAESAG